MSIRKARWISDAEAVNIKYMLRLDNTPKGIKSGLQALCVHYENNRILQDNVDHRQLIHSHLGSQHVLLRRWSMKALGLIGDRDDAPRLVDRLRVEQDEEAQTWGAAALLRTAGDRDVKEICGEAGLSSSNALLLAARLYASERWLKKYHEPLTVSLSDDELVLKWAIFLIGYDRAPNELFSPKNENNVFLGELNQHPSPEIAEYSVWALWERPQFGFSDLRFPPEQIRQSPDNVRKWLYRLMMQSQRASDFDPDLLDELRYDTSSSVREGLALGTTDLVGSEYDTVIIEWFISERDQNVRENLLAGLASSRSSNPEVCSLVEKQFKMSPANSGFRRRLLAASGDTILYKSLKRQQALDELAREGLDLFGHMGMTTTPAGLTLMTGPVLNIAGSVNTQNFVVGDMMNSANNAVQQLSIERKADHDVLEKVLAFLANSKINDSDKARVIEGVTTVVGDPTPANKKGLLGRLKSVGENLALVGGAAEGFESLVDLVSGWAS